ncbi:MAG: iron ABC transporter permease, partial [bacterium]|nr:iron ABC transporter permease [bacterium]
MALATTQKKLFGRKIFASLATLPLISPPFVLAIAMILLFGRQGVITQTVFAGTPLFPIYGFWGLALVEVLAYTPTAYLILKGVLEAIPASMKEAALNLGAGRRYTFLKIVLPLAKHGLISSFLLVFMESLADFGNPLILSGNFEVLAVKAYMEMTSFYNIHAATAMALMLLAPSLIAFFGQRLFLKKSVVVVGGKSQGSSFDWLGKKPRRVLFLLCSLYSLLIILMYGMICVGSVTKAWGVGFAFTLGNFKEVWELSSKTLFDSVFLAFISGPITGLLGMAIAYLVVRRKFLGRRLLEAVTLFAFAVPGTVLGLSYAIAFNKPVLGLPVLQGTWAIILLLFVVRNLPVGLQAGVAVLNQVDKSIEEAAMNLGAKGWGLFRRVTLPLMAPAFFTGWAYSFVKAITAISAVVFVVSGNWSLVTVDILGLVENGELSYAAALSLILIAIVILVLLGIKFFVGLVST